MREAAAYAPGHLTGFFQICDQPEDPLLKGSRGSGVSITKGIHTRVRVDPADLGSHKIYMDGVETDSAVVSENVLEKMLVMADTPHRIVVEHFFEIPRGAGFGSSGGGALTLALALNEALELGMTFIEAASIAHVAEIECRTGLGSVFAATVGGFGALVKPGGPGIGEAVMYGECDELSVVYLHFGPMATKDALSDPKLRARINELGGSYVDRIKDDLRPDLFMELSRGFTEHVGITTPRLRKVMDTADKGGVPCTMAMFGEVAFSLVARDEAKWVAEVLSEAAPGQEVEVLGVEERGAYLTR